MVSKTVRTIGICILLLSVVLLSYGGCSKDKKKDIQAKTDIKDKNICDQCAAMDCNGCKAAPICMGIRCGGCTQCGNDTGTNSNTTNNNGNINVTIDEGNNNLTETEQNNTNTTS